MKVFRVVLVLLNFFSFSTVFAQTAKVTPSANDLLEQMFEVIYSLENIRFDMYSKERVEGAFVQSHSIGIMEYSPKKVFIRGFDTDGVLQNEVLYLEGINDNNALVSPNGFPYINLNLDPEGNVMRKNRHFTILEAGGRYLVDMLKLGMETYQQNGDLNKRLTLDVDGEYYKITIINYDYDYLSYQVLEGENSRSVARKLGVPEYKIIELNDEIDSYDDIEPGQVIQVPNFYGQKVELVLRKVDFIPLEIRIFDDNGLYAEYVYKVFELNIKVPNDTFNSDNPAYTF